jgi:biofilm PGA synthesis protein PgaD
MNPPLIERPDRLSRVRRTILGSITALLWILYAYLWVPLLTFLAWLLGIHTAYQRLYLEDNAIDPFIMASLPVIALICGVLLIGWAEYNRIRFAHADSRRRRRRGDVGESAVDDKLGADHALGETLRSHRSVSVALDDQASPVAVHVLQS